MFRLIKLTPPHGWNAVAWEFGIVTVGVLMALALQQWAENMSSASRTARARQAIRQELADHYLNAVEWRVFSPCVSGQLLRIEQRIAATVSLSRPIDTRHIDKITVAVMAPRRIYDDSAWKGAISDGTALQLSERERKQLTNEYWLASQMSKFEDQFVDGDKRLLAATRPIELDPEVKMGLYHSIDEIRTATEMLDNTAAQILFWTEQYGAAPRHSEVQADSQKYGALMREFCRQQRLPFRKLATAMNPNS